MHKIITQLHNASLRQLSQLLIKQVVHIPILFGAIQLLYFSPNECVKQVTHHNTFIYLEPSNTAPLALRISAKPKFV